MANDSRTGAGMEDFQGDFHGAKAAVLMGDRVLVTLRDDFDWIAWPGHWDFVGGEREAEETPQETLAREAMEEVGLDLSGGEWLWEARFPSFQFPDRSSWFFVLRLPARAARVIRMEDEGQGWMLVRPETFLAMPRTIPSLRDRFAQWLSLDRAAAASVARG